jgi:microcystin-dependent protein
LTVPNEGLTSEEPPSSGTAATVTFPALDPVETMMAESAMAKGMPLSPQASSASGNTLIGSKVWPLSTVEYITSFDGVPRYPE